MTPGEAADVRKLLAQADLGALVVFEIKGHRIAMSLHEVLAAFGVSTDAQE